MIANPREGSTLQRIGSMHGDTEICGNHAQGTRALLKFDRDHDPDLFAIVIIPAIATPWRAIV